MNNLSLCEELPYWEFESTPISHAILADGSVSSGIEIFPLDIECFDESKINQLTMGLRAFANSLPEGLTCQIMVKVETDFEERMKLHQDLVVTEIEFLKYLDTERSERLKAQAHAGFLFRPKIFFFLKTPAAVKPGALSFGQTKKFAAEFERGYDDRLQTLSQALEGAGAAVSSLGFTTSVLKKEDLVDLLYRYLNPKRSVDIISPKISSRATALEGDSPRSQLVFGDLVIDQDDFILDSMRTRVLTLKTLPETTFAGMMSGFLALPFKYELLFSFHIPDQTKEMKSLEQKRRMAHSLAGATSNRVSDLESESRLSQTTDLIREIIESGQKIFQAEMMIVLREPTTLEGLKNINLHTKDILSRFKTLSGSEGIRETVGSWKVFKSNLPLAPMSLVRPKKMKTNNMVDFLPLYGAAAGDESPVCLMNSRLGTLYAFNPYDSRLSNYNMLVTGSSGSGKSFANNFLMLQQIARGIQVFVIDIGGSYRKMTECLGGQYFEISLTDNYSINPFELANPSLPPNGERLKGFVSILELMIVDHGEKLSRFERVLIENALTEVFAKVRSEKPARSPLISDFAKFCEKSQEEFLKRAAKLLFSWRGDSPFGKLLDRPGSIFPDKPIVAFDLKGLSQHPDLQAVMILILTNFILEQVEKDRSKQKRVLLDEAWELLRSSAASSFMEYAARTFRKTGSGITFITQGVEEIVTSGIGPAILNNTATKLIMAQKGDIKVLEASLKLNSQELKLIQSLEQRKGVFSEGFLMEGESRQIIRIEPSPLEYWISTSDSRDNQFLEKLMAGTDDLCTAIKQAAHLAPFGVGLLKQAGSL